MLRPNVENKRTCYAMVWMQEEEIMAHYVLIGAERVVWFQQGGIIRGHRMFTTSI